MKKSQGKNDLLKIIKFIFVNHKIYIKSVLFALVLAVIVTFLLPKKFRSTGIIFPTYSNSLEETYNNPMFGYDVEADRILQLLQSQEIQDSINAKFDLVSYYELDTLDERWRDELRREFFANINYSKTPFMSIEISARTKDPQLSANIVNAIIGLIDPIRNRILKQNIIVAHNSISKEYHIQKNNLDSLVNLIKTMRDEYGNPAISLLANQEFNFDNKKTGNNTLLEEKIDKYLLQKVIYNDIKVKYERVKTQLDRPLPGIYVINQGVKSNKKISPSFLINISIITILTIIIVSLVLVLKLKLKDLDAYLKND
ncbi:MAG: Wzz/FepE/Etk N-terminal domain-containing protein [Bacteroidia bacterium]